MASNLCALRFFALCARTLKTRSQSRVSALTKMSTLVSNQNSSKTFQVKQQSFEDTFGNIEGFEGKFESFPEDPEDLKEYERSKQAQGKTILEYMKEIKQHLQNHDYVSAVKVLEVDMVNDKKPLVSHIHDILIAYNADKGDLKEAYRLYTRFKRRGGLPSGGMYTSLFNACANCNNSMLALEKASAIREYLENDKRHKPNISNYNAMIKAYARHGDLSTCLEIFDEVAEKKDKVRSETYAFLLQACVSDKNSGLRHALIIWRKMLQNRVVPCVYSFNLMLRCVRECSFGETHLINNDLLKLIMDESQIFYKRKIVYEIEDGVKKRKVLKIQTDKNNLIGSSEVKNISFNEHISCPQHVHTSPNEDQCCWPNFLALNPTPGFIISFGPMTTPQQRFVTLGGVDGFLQVMSDLKVKPNIKTFTMLLDVVPHTAEAEEQLISKAKELGLKLDTCFFNVLIKRRNMRREYDLAEDAVKTMQKWGVQPDLVTFGVLAIGCSTLHKGLQLMNSVKSFGMRFNNTILGTLLANAWKSRDLNYVKAILQGALEDETKLDPKFTLLLEKIVQEAKRERKLHKIQ